MIRVLVIDVGGTNVKILTTGQKAPRTTPSGRTMTPRRMVADVSNANAFGGGCRIWEAAQ